MAIAESDAVFVNEKIRADFRAALRDVIDEDMREIVQEFLDHPVDESVCGDKDRFLNAVKITPQ